jgi:glycosyltransferase involved in cell wall biosynthesis
MRTVDIIIPVYNDEACILDSIASACSQKGVEVRCIVVNDGSNDNTEQIIKYSPYFNRIKYIKKDNGGVASARNMGLLHRSSQYCCFLDSDDILNDAFAAKAIDLMEKDGADFCYSNYIYVDEKDIYKTIQLDRIKRSKNPGIRDLMQRNLFLTPTVIINENLIEETNFSEELKYNEDWLFWLDIIKRARKVIYCSERLVKIRTRRGGLTSHKELHLIYYKRAIGLIEKKFKREYRNGFRNACVYYANDLGALGDIKSSYRYWMMSFPSYNFFVKSIPYLFKMILRRIGLANFLKKTLGHSKNRNSYL